MISTEHIRIPSNDWEIESWTNNFETIHGNINQMVQKYEMKFH
jgi:hypothetical protein